MSEQTAIACHAQVLSFLTVRPVKKKNISFCLSMKEHSVKPKIKSTVPLFAGNLQLSSTIHLKRLQIFFFYLPETYPCSFNFGSLWFGRRCCVHSQIASACFCSSMSHHILLKAYFLIKRTKVSFPSLCPKLTTFFLRKISTIDFNIFQGYSRCIYFTVACNSQI